MIAAAPERQAAGQKDTWTILDVLRWTTGRFTERGIASARLDAELLAAHALGLGRVDLYTRFDRVLGQDDLAGYRDLVRRRLGGEPVAYITGRKEFWSLDLAVDARVLVPRADTETLVEVALECLPEGAAARVADVGTGSGAVALAVKHARPAITMVACDASEGALAVARANAARLGLDVAFAAGHLGEPLVAHAPLDLLVANLPYVPSAEIAALGPEIAREPRLALDGGADGLDLIRALVGSAPALLAPGGAIALEVGAGQSDAVSALLAGAGLGAVRARCDLAGIPRVVAARRDGRQRAQ